MPFCAGAQNLIYSSNFTGNANDASGNGLHGVVTGATLTTGQTGVPNTAYYFDGIDDYITIPASPLTNLPTWTLHARFQIQGFYSGVCQGNGIIWHGVTYNDDHFHMEFMDNLYDNDCNTQTDTQSRLVTSPSGNATTTNFLSGPVVVPNTWYCAVSRYDGVNVTLSINGVAVTPVPWSNQFTSGPVNGRPTYIGGSGLGPNFPYWFKGKIDKIAIWDGAVTDSLAGAICLNLNEDTVVTTAVEMVTPELVEVGPNPATDRLNIVLPSSYSFTKLQVTNTVGQVMINAVANAQYSFVDISNLPIGVYFLITDHNGKKQTLKFLKQ